MSNSDRHFEYDVAISYAGEDRAYATILASVLIRYDVKVFFDQYEKSNIWGKNLYTHLSDVYENKARYCIMFLSKHYALKPWTKHELEAAQARSFKDNQEYILPIRIDNTEIPGIPSTIAYLNMQQETPESVANAILEKLKIPQITLIDKKSRDEMLLDLSTSLSESPEIDANSTSLLALTQEVDKLLDPVETTMKRPAVRLQPMQQQSTSSTQPNQSASQGGIGERSVTSKVTDGSLSNKERLLKGYQNQLAGAYDDAMQEYRIIIRNAPDLLGEVVNNMRALLKIAPKYTTGYRVLGDAYMRQGEYLQAMEAYNRALTMAKKARGENVKGDKTDPEKVKTPKFLRKIVS